MTLFLYLSGYALFLVFMCSEIEQDHNKAGWLYYALAVAFGLLWFVMVWLMLFRAAHEKWQEWRARRG